MVSSFFSCFYVHFTSLVFFFSLSPPSLSLCSSYNLELGNNGIGVLRSRGLAAEVTRKALTLSKGIEDGLLDADGVVSETHVSQHHDGAEEQRRGVRLVLAGNIGGGAVDGLEDGDLVTHVTRGGEAETADETGAHVGEDVAVQLRGAKKVSRAEKYPECGKGRELTLGMTMTRSA